ncbi:hypothetical protein ACLBKT_02595 [Erythrobacter sp. W302b]|uniref:hypothetical protein n=1 Tax=Erythrobacter sp. W302b TaxID=3389874 RepID=UPI00396B0CA8
MLKIGGSRRRGGHSANRSGIKQATSSRKTHYLGTTGIALIFFAMTKCLVTS